MRAHHPRRPARHGRVPADGRGDRAGRRRLLRREVRRDGPHRPGPGLQLRAVRRHALPRDRPDRRLRDHRRAEHRLRACGASRPSPAPAADASLASALDAARPRSRRQSARTRSTAVADRIAALQDELAETTRRLKARRRGRRSRSPASSPRAPRGRAGVRLVAAAVPFESMDAMKAATPRTSAARSGADVIALVLDADEPQVFVTVSDDLVARGLVRRRPREAGGGADRRQGRRPARDGTGHGNAPRRAGRGRGRGPQLDRGRASARGG